MSEKLFALLLRLYPTRFRARFGEESLQLLRDRLRDETGFFPRLRLLLDLLTDTAVAVPRAHRMPAPTLCPAPAASSRGLPSFHLLESQSLRPATFVLAAILGITTTGAFAILLHYAGINHASRLATIEADAAAHRRWTDGGFLGRPAPPPPPPPSYDMFDAPNAKPPSAVLQPHDAGVSPAPADFGRPVRPAAHPPSPGPSDNNLVPTHDQPLTPIIMVPVLGSESGPARGIPVPPFEEQLGTLSRKAARIPANDAPAGATPAPPFASAPGRRSIVVMNPTTEPPPCPATTSETGSNSSTKLASSAASAQKFPPCSKSPKLPTGSRSPASAAAPK